MKQSNFFSVFKPLKAACIVLTNPLTIRGSRLYSLVLTYCAMLGSGQLVLGQEMCQTVNSCGNHLDGVSFTPQQTAKITGNMPYVVNLYIHIQHNATNPSATTTIEQAYQAFQTIQNVYYPHNIYFRLHCIDYFSSDDEFDQITSASQGIHLFSVVNAFNQDATIYEIPGLAFQIRASSMSLISPAHELGHCLGLYHTFHGIDGSCGDDGCPDNPELVNQNTGCLGCECLATDGNCVTNCQCCTSGDFVCDTYATEKFSVNADCSEVYLCDGLDPNNTSYNGQSDNVMSYGYFCRDKMTHGQAVRIRSTLEATTPFNGILFSTLLANINTDGYTLANYTLPAGSTLWNTPRHIIGKITVPNGATLSISNTTVAFEGTAAGITVEKGGKLIIDHATLRDNSCAATPWQGITVNGNGFVPHPANYLTTNSPDHGIVVVKNGSVIENAQYGIYTAELNTSALGYAEYTGGGIIDVQSSTLRNNLVGIHIGHFYGCQPFPLNVPPANAQQSKVLNNTFINTTPYLGNPTLPYTHLYLNRSEAVRVDGNTFQTQANTGFTTQTRGTGIVATNTSTTIGSNTLALSNTFINLYKGVDVYNTLTAVSVTNVVRNQFLETDKAITLNSVPFATIENNIIDVKTGTATNDTYGILTTASFGFDILNNFFNSNAPDGNLYTKGIVVQQSYYTNTQQDQALTRDNAFAGKFAASTQIEGDCRNLQTQCNMYYSGSKYDWYIAPNYPYLNGTPAATLLDEQGICSAPNPNLSFATYWHPTATGTYHIKNNAVAPITINYDIDSNPTATSGNVIKTSCSALAGQPIKNNSCGYFVTVPDVCCTNGAICESGIAVAGRIRYLY